MNAPGTTASAPAGVGHPGVAPEGMSMSTLLALAVAGLGIGFAAFTYTVPYSRALKEQKLLRGQLMSVQAEASGRQRELEQLRKDLTVAGHSSDGLVAVRSEMSIMSAKIQELARGLPTGTVTVTPGMRTLRVRFSESALFDARGPAFTREGQGAVERVASLLADKVERVLVTAPMGDVKLARWVADNYPAPGDLAGARVRNVVRILQRAVSPREAVWGVAAGGPEGKGEAAIEIEIEPRG